MNSVVWLSQSNDRALLLTAAIGHTLRDYTLDTI